MTRCHCFSTSTQPGRLGKSSFDLFEQLKTSGTDAENKTLKRKPSSRVVKLADQVLSLSLTEAADLCELCQEALQSRSGQDVPPGRTPFPHPGGFFAGAVTHGVMPPMGIPMNHPYSMGMPGNTMPINNFQVQPPTEVTPTKNDVTNTEVKPSKSTTKVKENVTVRLQAYDTSKKVAVVKEVRAFCEMGLKDAKDTVEAAPKILKREVPMAEAEKWKVKLEAVGATITIE